MTHGCYHISQCDTNKDNTPPAAKREKDSHILDRKILENDLGTYMKK